MNSGCIMKWSWMNFRLLFAVLCCSLSAAFASELSSSNSESADIVATRLGRGVNVLGYDKYWQQSGGGRFRLDHFAKIRKVGFATVRVNLFTFRHFGQDGRLNEEWLRKLDAVIVSATASGLNVILDVHDFSECGKAPDACSALLKIIWGQLSSRYVDYGGNVLFELLNEPNNALTVEKWNELIPDLLKIIRRNDPGRYVLISAANWGKVESLDSLKLPVEDRRIIVTFHYYSPYGFTHQGAPWAAAPVSTNIGLRFGSEADVAQVQSDFARAAQWSRVNNRPLFLGEFGAYDKAPRADRLFYLRTVARTAERFGISWAVWQFSGDFVVYDHTRDDWVGDVVDALIPK